ncbi:MAG: DUF1844 domain-containing protein [Acidobacteriota bacterium]
MAEREETGFKVTDRRKYNPDGSPRDSAEPGAPGVEEAEAPAPLPEQPAGNVVSFPVEGAKKQPQAGASPQAAAAASESSATSPASTKAPIAAGPTAAGSAAAGQAAAGQVEQAYNQARGPQSSRLPEPSFFSLANMLAVEAAVHLGLIQTPGEEAPPLDLEAARHLIDMLGMLETKTRGNLTEEEANLLENVLADLRMQFVAISKER